MTPGQNQIRRWREDPILFVKNNFAATPDAWQADALLRLSGRRLQPRRRVGMKACTGPGKSTVLAWGGWHRLVCFAEAGEHPKGAAISGEGRDNLRDNLWAELAKWQGRSEFLTAAFTWTNEKIFANAHPATWFLSARGYARDADAESIGRSLSGLHSKFPFVLLDETGNMPITVGQKAEQIFTGGVVDGLIMAAGNPTSTSGLLYHIANQLREQWPDIITITADPDNPKRTPRVDIEHAREQIRMYGRDNPWVMATIFGEFPPGGFNSLLTIEEVEEAMARHMTADQYGYSQKRLGVDVARFGDDRTVIFPRQGLASFTPVEMRNARTTEVAVRVAAAKSRWNSELEFVDDTGGYGGGVIDILMQSGHSPIPVCFSGKAMDPRNFNKRTEIWLDMAKWVKRGGCLPRIPSLMRELTQPTYAFQNGKYRLEEKAQIKKRLLFSPDMGDALAMTFAMPDLPATGAYDHLMRRDRVAHEYDPYGEQLVGKAGGSAVCEYDPFSPERAI